MLKLVKDNVVSVIIFIAFFGVMCFRLDSIDKRLTNIEDQLGVGKIKIQAKSVGSNPLNQI